MQQYVDLVKKVLDQGIESKDRTGTGTKFLFSENVRYDLRDGFPLLGVKKTNFRALAYEMLWFLGTHRDTKPYDKLDMTNIKFLVDNGIHIWSDWPYKIYKNYYEDLGYSTEQYRARKNDISVDGDLSKKVSPLGTHYIIYSLKQFNEQIKQNFDFAERWGNLGPVYGKQWREWVEYTIADAEPSEDLRENTFVYNSYDQVTKVIDDLRNKPWDRGIKINSWNVSKLDQMALRPCHYDVQFRAIPMNYDQRFDLAKAKLGFDEDTTIISKEKLDELNIPNHYLSLQLNLRSNDIGLGHPFNVAQYALLLMMISQIVNMIPAELSVIMGDAHLYKNHLEKMKEVVRRWEEEEHFLLPTVKLNENITDIDDFTFDDFTLTDYQYHPWIKLPVAV